MECPSCRAAVAEGDKFCRECGTKLPEPCHACGRINPPGSNFCSQCGARLATPTLPPSSSTPARLAEPPTSLAERRQLTVMFCDLVGSTALSTRLDPEDLRAVLGAYHMRVTQVVLRFEGFVARYVGDSVLSYFGYPNAHEDDPERAVRAGLTLVQEIGALRVPEQLQIRVGIATGLAVVGDIIDSGSSAEHEVVGEVPNLAARLQAIAEPNAIVISETTYRQVGLLFEVQELGPQMLKGFGEPQFAWRVLGESGVHGRFEALHPAKLTPLVGREEEIDLLMRRWTQAKQGAGRVALIEADAGVGKSRLAAALVERLQEEPHTRLQYFCSRHYQESALFPVISQLEHAAGFERNDTPQAKLDKLEALLAPTMPQADDAALLAELLSIPALDRLPPLKLSPQAKKERTFQALLRWLSGLAGQRPVLIVLEDLHWLDPTSHELLDRIVGQAASLPILLVVTLRPEVRPAWGDQPHVTTLTLTRLGSREGTALIQSIASSTVTLPNEVINEIVERADGVPLFLEEVTKAVLEAAGANPARLTAALSAIPGRVVAVPPTLQASLMARLDRLGPAAKEAAQVGSVIGREFSFELLAAVAQRPESELRRGLGQLVDAGLLFQRGMPPLADYSFKHALVQDAAYSTLLRGARQTLHARIAQALESKQPNTAEIRPELIAYHLTEAGFRDRAIAYWQRAGELALRRSAVVEAMKHFSHALQILEELPETPDRAGQEVEIRLGLGTALNIARGSSHPDVAEQYARAVTLGREIGESTQLFRALWGSWYTTLTTGQSEKALALADELVPLAERLGDEDLMLEAYHSRWATSHTMGLNAATLADTERGIALYDRDRHHVHAYHYGGHDTGVCAFAHNAMTQWITGFPDKAARMSDAALELGHELGHPPSLAHAAWWSAIVRQVLGELQACRELAELAMRIAREQESKIFVVCPTLVGWAVFESGEMSEGLELIEQRIISTRQSGRRFYYDYELLLFADALLRAGAPTRALEAVDEAIDCRETTGSRLFIAEARRLKGLCLVAMDGTRTAEAENWLEEALDIAERQSALSLKLRAATSLARLWGDQGRRSEAHGLLASTYGRFSEGFDTRDLKAAKALLDDLGPR